MPTAPQPLRAREPRWPAAPPQSVVEYPDQGCPPMTSVHLQAMLDALLSLRDRYAHRDDVYVGSELTMYWREGDRRRWVQPDVFVAFGLSRTGERDVWLVWEEGKFADFVIEVASRSTHRIDQAKKRPLYESLGVTEYWRYDPTGKFLPTMLVGHRLNAKGTYEPVPLKTNPDGALCGTSEVLNLHLCLDDDRLRLFDPATNEILLTHNEHVRTSAEKDLVIENKDRIIAEERRLHAEERRAFLAEIEALKRQGSNP